MVASFSPGAVKGADVDSEGSAVCSEITTVRAKYYHWCVSNIVQVPLTQAR